MRGQVGGREIDDVGEQVLSYAEVKALATGNPLVIEQAGVQAELAKLDRRALAHQSDQRRLQGIATYARRDAELHRQKAAALAAALTRRVDTAGDKFRMEIDGQVHTSRADAGGVLFAKAEAAIGDLVHRQGRDETRLDHIGRLGGFAVTLQGIKNGLDVEARITVQVNDAGVGIPVRLTSDDLRSRSPERVVAGIEASIRNLDSRVEEAERWAAEADAEAERAEARLQPFPDQDRLDQLQRRYTEILDQLEADAAADEARRAGTAPATGAGEEAQAAPPSPAGPPAVAEHPTDLGPGL